MRMLAGYRFTGAGMLLIGKGLGSYGLGISLSYLFRDGTFGIWLDSSDLLTMFQDIAGTMPVTTAGQFVALMLDKSGNGNHVTQANPDLRPTYQTDGTLHWLEFDGVDDRLESASPLPFSTEIFSASASRMESYTASFPRFIVHRGGALNTAQRQPVVFYSSASPKKVFVGFGTSILDVDLVDDVVGQDIVITGYASPTEGYINVNGVTDTSGGITLTDGGVGGFNVGVGEFDGRFYGAVQVNKVPSIDQRNQTRLWLESKAGVAL